MRRLNLATILVVLALMLAFMGASYLAGVASASDGSSENTTIISQLRSMSKRGLVDRALSMLEQNYFMEIDTETKRQMIYGAVQGLLTVLRSEPFNDDFSHFYDPELYSDLMAQTTGEYAGVGILMGITADGMYPEIVTVFPGTPAEETGLLSDDIITLVDDQETLGLPLPRVATRIKGEPGTTVSLQVYRPSEGELLDVEIVRRDVEFSSVDGVEMLEHNIGYLRISTFAEETLVDFRGAMEQLMTDGAQTVVIDLRNNTGGLLDAAIAVADCFVPEGRIVEVRTISDSKSFIADPATEKFEIPLVLLINGNTASASEVLTGALMDHGLATVIGEKSFGKGIVQDVKPMELDSHGQPTSALAITIGRYYTPQGNDIHGTGIEPNIWYDISNQLADDPELKSLEQQINTKRDELQALRTAATQYLRDHDAVQSRAIEVAALLARGEEVPDVAQLVLEEQVAQSPSASVLRPNEGEEPLVEEEQSQ